MESQILIIPPWIRLHNKVAKLVVTVLLWCSGCCNSYTSSLGSPVWSVILYWVGKAQKIRTIKVLNVLWSFICFYNELSKPWSKEYVILNRFLNTVFVTSLGGGAEPAGAEAAAFWTCPWLLCCHLEQSELHPAGSGPLRGMVRQLQVASALTYSAMVATQEPLVTGHGGSQQGLAKELTRFYWRKILHSSNYSFDNTSTIFSFI